jgi:cytochrome c biogenesis protein CcmG/thiol:disulfide interchange protein DsbE
MTEPAVTAPAPAQRRLPGLLALAGALAFAAGVTAYLFLSGGGDETFVANVSAVPTPFSNTGVLEPQRPKVDSPAPDFALIDARDGQTVRKLSDYRGKAVVVNWYASWCAPCKAEIPEFQKAAIALDSQVVFLGVDYQEGREKATGILAELGATYPAVLDNSGAVGDHYGVPGLPSTFFIDKDGVLRVIKSGQLSKEELVADLAKAGVTYQP